MNTEKMAERFDDLAKRDRLLRVERTESPQGARHWQEASVDFNHPATVDFRRLCAEAGESMLARAGEGEMPDLVHAHRFFAWLFDRHGDDLAFRVIESSDGPYTFATIENAAGAASRALRREAARPQPEQPEPWRGVLIATRTAAEAVGYDRDVNKKFRREFVDTGLLSPADTSDRPHRFRAGELFDALQANDHGDAAEKMRERATAAARLGNARIG